MRFLACVAVVLACSASNAVAGRIFGDIKVNGKPVGAGVPVTIAPVPGGDAAKGDKGAPGLAPYDSAGTDSVGSYKVVVKSEGKCLLTVLYEKQSASLEVFSYKAPTRYDLLLEKKDGKLTVKRK